MDLSSKPKSLFCYLCGRQYALIKYRFGTKSLQIHLKTCVKKFSNSQAKKQSTCKIKQPQVPSELQQILQGNLDADLINSYNEKAIAIHKYQVLPSCRFCGRTFNEQSLKAHENACSKQNKTKVVPKSTYKISEDIKKPRVLTCCVCGRQFGLTSLKIHYPQCVEKFRNDEKKKPKQMRKQAPSFTKEQQEMIKQKTNWSVADIEDFNNLANTNYRDKGMVQCSNCQRKFIESAYEHHKKNCALINGKSKIIVTEQSQKAQSKLSQSVLKKPRVLMCCICGRQFGLTSLVLHQSKCCQKFTNEQKKKPFSQRKKIPKFPVDEDYNIGNTNDWTVDKIQQYNYLANQVYREDSLSQCYICHRKFLQDSLVKHLKYCEQNQERINAKNGNEGQTNLSKSNNFKISPSKKIKSITANSIAETEEMKNKREVYQQIVQQESQFLQSTIVHEQEENNQFIEPKKQKQMQEKLQTPIKIQKSQKNIIQKKLVNQKKEQIQQKVNNQEKAKMDVSSVLEQCVKCGRNFNKDRINKHTQVCKGNNKKQRQGIIVKEEKQTKQKQNKNYNEIQEQIILKQCQKCGRKFAFDRIQKHYNVCKGTKKIQEVKLPSGKYNLDNIEVEEESSLRNQLLECNKCGRKFMEGRLAMHVSKCKDIKKEKGVKKQTNKDEQEKKKLDEEKINEEFMIEGQNQFIDEEQRQCRKCGRRFKIDRIIKHEQVCKSKGINKEKINNNKKMEEQKIRKTKQNFYNMVKDIKGKKIMEEEIDYNLNAQLKEINKTRNRRQNKKQINSNQKQYNKNNKLELKNGNRLPKI